MNSKASHWENIYGTKGPDEVSWTQDKPTTSLQLINQYASSKDAAIIDIGGGDSKLVDHLLEEGYTDITVLDISLNALNKAKARLKDKASQVEWVHADITSFSTEKTFDLWHDRAVFHFLIDVEDRQTYVKLAKDRVQGSLVISSFSDEGPLKCSGLEIKQYTARELEETFREDFALKEHFKEDHITPFKTVQNFQFAVLSK